MSNKTRITALLVVACLLFACIPVAYARYSNTESFNMALGFTGSKAVGDLSIIGRNGTTRITGTARLFKVNTDGSRTIYTSWNVDTYSQFHSAGYEYYIGSRGTYCFEFEGYVYWNGTGEYLYNHVDALY